jgi:hypothetical protein
VSGDGHAAGLFVLDDPGWRRKILRGGLLICLPVVGWPAILGYRRALAAALFGTEPVLPPWEGRFLAYLLDGLRAMCVIFGYLAPLYALAGWLAYSRGFRPGVESAAVAGFFVLFPIFSTLSLPIAAALLVHGGRLAPGEAAAFGGAYAAIIFIVPAGFLEVSRTGRHRSAFAVWRTLPFLARNLRGYASAWWNAGLASLFGHAVLPFSPWSVVWAYLAIIFLFNAILVRTGAAPADGWLGQALRAPRARGLGRLGRKRLEDAGGEPCTALDLRAFSVPLPRCVARTVTGS